MSGRTPGRILQFSRTSLLTPYAFRVKRISCDLLLAFFLSVNLVGTVGEPRRRHGTSSSGSRRYHVIPVSGRAVSPLLRWLSGRPTSETVSGIRRSARHHSSARCANSGEGWSRVYGGAIPVTQWDASVDHLQQGRRGDAELLSEGSPSTASFVAASLVASGSPADLLSHVRA